MIMVFEDYKTKNHSKSDNIINKFVVYLFGAGRRKKMYLTHVTGISPIRWDDIDIFYVDGVDYLCNISGTWRSSKCVDTSLSGMIILDKFDTLEEAIEYYEMIENMKKYNL
jgi:alpha-D-ribose 1-methylphosphonate 5-phosphate C-P lyase